MNKDEILEAVKKLLFEESGEIDREEYKEMLTDVIGSCEDMLNAMDEEDEP
jgi:hypothetical protein